MFNANRKYHSDNCSAKQHYPVRNVPPFTHKHPQIAFNHSMPWSNQNSQVSLFSKDQAVRATHDMAIMRRWIVLSIQPDDSRFMVHTIREKSSQNTTRRWIPQLWSIRITLCRYIPSSKYLCFEGFNQPRSGIPHHAFHDYPDNKTSNHERQRVESCLNSLECCLFLHHIQDK